MVTAPEAGSMAALTCRFFTPTPPRSAVSSWKWVAKRVGQPTASMRCSEMAQARAMPSQVLVPRPSSSTMTREAALAPLRMAALSSISAMKVDTPRAWLSPAPTRAKMASRTGITARAQGTQLPTWARSTAMPTWRMKVDLPPMLGPVMSWNQDSPRTMRQSLGTKSTPSCSSTQGCRQASSTSSAPSRGSMTGRTYGLGAEAATSAKLASTSSSASTPRTPSHTGQKVAATDTTCATSAAWRLSYSQDSACSRSAAALSGLLVNLMPSLRVSSSRYLA